MDIQIIASVGRQVNIHTIACVDPTNRCDACWGSVVDAEPAPAEAATGVDPVESDDLILEAAYFAAWDDADRYDDYLDGLTVRP